ncbi:MAG: succinylglutamate desuccinylase/aspartoacylase family protein [Planctomycetota bacterium]|jgi:predicted deacylase
METDADAIRRTTISGTRDGPHLLVTGGVHGDEFEPVVAIHRLSDTIEADTLCGTVTLVPAVNGPAVKQGRRTAADGLDLARSCPGRPDGSATERIAHALARLIRSADLYVDLHSGGTALEILPMVGYMLHSDRHVLDRQRRMARAFNLPIIWGTTASLEGRSLSVARDASVPAIYAEWGGGGGCHPRGVADYVAGCLDVMAAFDMLDRQPRPGVIEHVVEDDRPESGHLQVCYPAPSGGLFEPSVEVGQRVTPGDRLGRVVDWTTGRSEPVLSTQSGIILCRRVFSRVEAGDSLGVVLETD